MDFTTLKYGPRILKAYYLLDNINRLLIALVISKTCFTLKITFTNNQLLTFILTFLFSILLSEIVYRISKSRYRPTFMVKEHMNYADWIDTNIGPKQNFDLVNEDLYKIRYKFELAILAFFYTVIISFVLLLCFNLITNIAHFNIPLILSWQYSLRVPILLIIYPCYLGLLLLLINNIKLTMEKDLPWDYGLIITMIVTIIILLCLLIFIIFSNDEIIIGIDNILKLL